MKVLPALGVALLSAACASSRGDLAEPSPAPPVPPTLRWVRTHEPRPAEETNRSTNACDAGDLAMCHAAALDAYYAPRSPETDARARALFEQACKEGYAPSCNGLGVLYDAGRGVAKDPKAAVDLYRRACAADGSTGCQHLAIALRAGRGVAKDALAAERAEARGQCLLDFQRDPGTCPTLDGSAQ